MKMIMKTTDSFDYEKSREFLKAKTEAERRENLALHKRASEDCRRIIEMIKSYAPDRIYQWGSLLNPDEFDVNSDIDIAVEGIDSVEVFFELFGKAMEMTDFPVDIVEMEKIEAVHAESIKQNGQVVYEK